MSIRYTVLYTRGVRDCDLFDTAYKHCVSVYIYNFKSQIAVFSYSLVTLTCVCFPKQAFILLLYIPKE